MYSVNQSGGGEIGPVNRASFRAQRDNDMGSFFKGFIRFVKPLLYMVQRLSKRGFKTVSNIITRIYNKEREQPVGNIFKNSFSEAKGNLEEKLKI